MLTGGSRRGYGEKGIECRPGALMAGDDSGKRRRNMQCLFEPRSGFAGPAASSFSRRRHIDLQRVASCLCHA
jgi:hypothetical protein